MHGTTVLIRLLFKRPALGLSLLGSNLLTAGLVIAACFKVDDPPAFVLLCLAAAPPALMSVRLLNRGAGLLQADRDA